MAITCGMPLPRVARRRPSVSQASAANASGVSSSGNQAARAVIQRNKAKAALLAWVNRIAARPTTTAPLHSVSRRFQWCGAKNSWPSRACKGLRGGDASGEGIAGLSQTRAESCRRATPQRAALAMRGARR
uniref:Uncharacterized protein n=1 Tax=Mizugakiibacter sediminis TaxID=1475481 RepID=A0A0S6Z1W8_9GAMM